MLKSLICKIIYREKSDSVSYCNYLRKQGASVGERTIIFAPRKVLIDMTRPWLIEIGNDVQITEGVTILTHGYDWSVLKGVYGDVLGSSGRVKIGNNVFIGVNTTILKGVHIGNNTIIGAGSLVDKDIPDNFIAAGNPARVIISIDEYFEKRKNAQINEAKELVRIYRQVYGKEPERKHLSEFFWLFDGEYTGKQFKEPSYESKMKLVGNYEKSIGKYCDSKRLFNNFEEFLRECDK